MARPLPHDLLRRRPLAGFTLIELLVVIVIIGILVAIGVPAYLKYAAAANDRDAQAALQVAYKAAVAGDTEVNTAKFPVATTIVNDVKADEPAASIARGDCYASVLAAPVKQVLVDTSSTAAQLTICDRSASGTIWRLSGPLTGTPTISNGSTAAVTFAGGSVGDAVRAAGVSGDGRSSPDSSTGVWEASANLIPAGDDADLHGYNGSDTGVGSVVGGGFYRFSKGGPALSQIYSFSKVVSVASGQTYTWSAVIRTDGTGWDFRPGSWDASTGNINPAATVVDLGNGTYRLSGTWTATATIANLRAFDLWETNWGTSTYVDVKWTQFEQKTIATPYMQPGSPRAAALVEQPGALVNGTQGWAAVRIRPGFSSAQTGMNNGGNFETFFSWQIDTNNRITCFWDETAKKFVTKRVLAGGFNQANSAAQTFSAGGYLTLVFAWTSTQLYVSVNGAPFASTPDTNIPAGAAPSLLDVGARAGATQYGDSDVMWFASGTGTLADADAATINGFGNNDPSRSSFPSNAQADFVWDGASAAGSMK